MKKMPLKADFSPSSALSSAGEAVLGDFSDIFSKTAAQVSNVLSPGKAFLSTLRSFLGGSLGLILKPKALIPALLMAALWFVLVLMKDSGIPLLKTLSRLTYAEGGFTADPFGTVGGIFGKGVVAAALSSLFTGGLPSAVKGIGSLFRTKGEKRSLILTLLGLIFGAGLYYFFSGAKIPSPETSASGIAGALLSLEILGSKSSVFYKFIQSLTSKAKNGVHTAMNGRCDSLLTGLTLGFTLGIFFWGGAVSAAGADLYYEYEKYGTKYFVLNISGLNSSSIGGSGSSGSTSNPFGGEDADFSLATGSGVVARGNKIRMEFEWMSPNPLDEWNIGIKYDLQASKTYCGNKNLYDSFDKKSERTNTQWSSVVTRNSSGIILEITAPTEGEIESIALDVGMDYNCGENKDLGVVCSFGNVPFEIALTGASSPAVCPDIVVTEQAKIKPGRDEGVSVPIEIIEGIKDKLESIDQETLRKTALISSGGAAVAGGISALIHSGKKDSSSEEDESEEKKKRKSCKMYVWKDFGDAIRKGAKPVKVYARISQFIEGAEYDAPELTDKITVSGRGLNVRAAGFENSYLCAEVSADAGTAAESGTLIFTLSGPGGTFSREINFRLVGEPRIVFPDETEDGSGWVTNADLSTVNMIAGAGGNDRIRFVLVDAAEEPKAIRFLNHDGFEITKEKDSEYEFTYWAMITNRTAPMEKEDDIFADMKDYTFTVEADFSGGLTVSGYFGVYLYPQGLSVLKDSGPNKLISVAPGFEPKLKDGWLEVISYATRDKDALTLDPLIRPTGFDLCSADLRPDGTASIVLGDGKFTFGKLKPTDEATKNILAKYHYDVTPYAEGFAFRPEDSLPASEKDYRVYLPVSLKGEKIELPVHLIGEPSDPMQDWNEEFQKLIDTVRRYFPPEFAPKYEKNVRESYSDPEIWDKSALRIARRDIVRCARDFWTRQAGNYLSLVDYYDTTEFYFKKVPRFMGDTAFKIVMIWYYGDNEAWITPCKDLFVDTVDEVFWNFIYTDRVNIDESLRIIRDNLMTQATNAIENSIQIADASGVGFALGSRQAKKMAFGLCAFMMMDWTKTYVMMNPRDFYESIRKTFFDVSVMAVKKLIGTGFSRMMNSEIVRNFFKNKFFDFLNKYVTGASKIDGLKVNPKVEANEKVLFINFGNMDRGTAVQGELKDMIRLGTGKDLTADQLISLEEARKMIAAPGMESEFYKSLKLDQVVSYRSVLQTYLDKLFGDGIATIAEGTDLDPNSSKYGEIRFPVYWPSGKKEYILLDLNALFTGITGITTMAFEFLYESMFGWFSLPSGTEASHDSGIEVDKIKDMSH